MSRVRRTVSMLTVLILAALSVACGGDDGEAEPTETPAPAFTPTETETEAGTPTATAATTPTGEPTETPDAAEGAEGAEGSVYTVEEGDNLSAIAERFDTTVDALVEANQLDDPDTIFPGDQITIPEAEPAAEASPG